MREQKAAALVRGNRAGPGELALRRSSIAHIETAQNLIEHEKIAQYSILGRMVLL